MADRERRVRLDQPVSTRGRRPSLDPERFGRASERIARFIGSWRFITYMTLFVLAWVLWNTFAPEDLQFDSWPFIGLTLVLSLQASYAAPLILLAQNRQADRDHVQYLADRVSTDRMVADTEFLSREVASLRHALGDMATRDFIRAELRDLLTELDDRDERAEPSGTTPPA